MAKRSEKIGGLAEWKRWCLDVSQWPILCFCPIDNETGDIITGINLVTNECPGELSMIMHFDGKEAVDAFVVEHEIELQAIADHKEFQHGKAK